MYVARNNEIEYLGRLEKESLDTQLVDELSQRLEALRRFDQNFSENDWRPHPREARWRPNSPLRAG